MKNYIGYFRGIQSNKLYSVKIIGNPNSNEYEEVTMAGSDPFVVKYNNSSNIFDTIRISTATINIVNDNYMLDAFTPSANGTKVILTDVGSDIIKWYGYLKPNLYNQGYSEEYETIELEASDLLASMQYFNYGDLVTTRGLITFNNLIGKIFDKIGNIKFYLVSKTKVIGYKYLNLADLTISEENFFTSDTDEGWKCDEVINEICKYLGYTLIQIGKQICFVDLSYFRKKDFITFNTYSRGTTGIWGQSPTEVNMGSKIIIADNTPFMGGNHSVSMDNIYNKAVVKCSTYKIDDLLPSIFDDGDDVVTPMFGDWTNCQYINSAASSAKYVNGKGKVKSEETSDTKYVYVNRFLKNKYYDSCYYDFNLKPTTPSSLNNMVEVAVTSYSNKPASFVYWGDDGDETMYGYSGTSGTIKLYNNDTSSHTVTIKINMLGTRSWYFKVYDAWAPEGYDRWYSGCGEHDGEDFGHSAQTITKSFTYTIAAGASKSFNYDLMFTDQVAYSNDADGKLYTTLMQFLYMSASMSIDGATDVPLTMAPFGNGSSASTASLTYNFIGATLVDYASYDKIPTTVYNFEPTSSLDFTRYLCINQHNQPYGQFFGPGSIVLPTPWGTKTWSAPDSLFPTVYKLKSGFKRPLVVGNDSFLAINANVLYERYVGRNYINSEWTDEATGLNNSIFHFGDQAVGTCAGNLVLCLGLGNKYWNGSEWQTTKCLFKVPLSTSVDDKYNTDFTKVWNTNFHCLNNFSWEEWADAKGYKIPLEGVDCSQEITFEIHMPTKLQYYYDEKHSDSQKAGDEGLNGYCWISDLDIKVGNKGQSIDEDEDIVYENVIEDTSINKIEEVELKINTNPNKGPLSYSYVGLNGSGYLQTIKDQSINGVAQKPEENIIEKLVNQYSTTTKTETLTVNLNFNALTKIVDGYWNETFVVLGQEIDYLNDSQTITIQQLK